jgi:hypothetical protein
MLVDAQPQPAVFGESRHTRLQPRFEAPSTGGNPLPMIVQDCERRYLKCIRGTL